MQKFVFIFANSADPDEMLHLAAFHQGLHCFPKYRFAGIQNEKCKKRFKQIRQTIYSPTSVMILGGQILYRFTLVNVYVNLVVSQELVTNFFYEKVGVCICLHSQGL